MAHVIEILSRVSTPLAFAAVLAGVALYGYYLYLKSCREKLNSLPENDRAKSVDQQLTRYGIDGSNLTRDQKYELIGREMTSIDRRRVIYATLGAIVIIIVIAAVLVANGHSQDVQRPPDLVLRMTTEGTQIINTKNPHKGSGAVFDFTLSNSGNGLIIVDSMKVEVVDVLEAKWAVTAALISEYKFEATLDPANREGIPFGRLMKYGPGDVDLISVNLSSTKPGYDYFIRFAISWRDGQMKENRVTKSEILVAHFPPTEMPEGLSRDEIGRKYEEQESRVRNRLEDLRRKAHK